MATDDDLLKEAREEFDLCAEAEKHNRDAFVEAVKFARLGGDHQWTVAGKNQAEARRSAGKPVITINTLNPHIRQVVNDGRQNKPAISVHPADSQSDPETAKIMGGLIRNIEYASDAQTAYDTALDNAVTGGFGYWRVNLDFASDDSFDKDIRIERVANPLSVYGDPFSQAADSSDWNTAYVMDMIERDRFEDMFKGADADAPKLDWDGDYESLASPWREDDRIMVVERWKREEITYRILNVATLGVVREDEYKRRVEAGEIDPLTARPFDDGRMVKGFKVTQQRTTGAEVLDSKPLEWAGRYIPIIPVYGDEVNIEGKRYFRGLVHDAMDAARNFNFWRSVSAELISLAPRIPFVGPVGAFKTDPNWDKANTANISKLEYDVVQNAPGGGKPERQPYAGVPSGVLQEALNASDDIKRTTGQHDASLGARSNETSGVAINARQREGDVSTFHYIDNLSRAIAHTGRILIDLIPKVYTEERVLRVLGPEGPSDIQKARVGPPELAQPAQQAREMLKAGGVPPEIEAEVRETANIYALGLGKYDITVQAGPSFTTQRQEAAAQITEAIRAHPPLMQVIGDLYFKTLDIQNAEEMAQRLKKLLPPQLQDEQPQGGQQGAQMQQAQAAVQQVTQQAQAALQQMQQQLAQTSAELEAARQGNELKAAEIEVKKYEAETRRMAEANKQYERALLPGAPFGAPVGPMA